MKTFIPIYIMLALICGASKTAFSKYVEAIRNETSMTYHLTHPLHKIEATSADVYFKINVDPGMHSITYVYGKSDVTTFSSGNSERDSHAMEVIDALTYPDVEFTGSDFAGVDIKQSVDSIWVTGKLTFHGVTKEVRIPARATWSSDKLVVIGAFGVSLTAFNIERPSLLMIPTEDLLMFDFKASFPLQ